MERLRKLRKEKGYTQVKMQMLTDEKKPYPRNKSD